MAKINSFALAPSVLSLKQTGVQMQLSTLYPAIFLVPRQMRSSRLLLLGRPFMLIPLVFWLGLYSFAAFFVMFAAFWGIMFTGRYPKSMWPFMDRYFRLRTRFNAYTMLLSDAYPPFNGVKGGYPVETILTQPERLSRLMAFFRLLISFPHMIFGMFYTMAYAFVAFLNFWAVLFTGHIPQRFWNFILRYFIYTGRLRAYLMTLVDEYPPFNGRQPTVADAEFRR